MNHNNGLEQREKNKVLSVELYIKKFMNIVKIYIAWEVLRNHFLEVWS